MLVDLHNLNIAPNRQIEFFFEKRIFGTKLLVAKTNENEHKFNQKRIHSQLQNIYI